MKSSRFVSLLSDSKDRFYLCSLLISVSFLCVVYFTGSAFVAKDYQIVSGFGINSTKRDALPDKCKGRCRPFGSEALPEGIVSRTSNLEMHTLFGDIDEKARLKGSVNLLAMPVGIKQKALVNKIVQKFLENNFVIILFHYDGLVDEWNDLDWSVRTIHISAKNQTKWWFAKRFLHPDIVSEYEYIFLWDEDLGVENFHPGRYLSIAKEEGLEISQPALDPATSVVHNTITVRIKKLRVHRRYLKLKGGGRCYENSTAPPCVGWVEMMAPVFSRAAWRCTWYMIQNDLIHAWGLDRQLGYCAQGDRSVKVGVIDEEYIVHLGIPTLGDASGGTSASDDNYRFAVRSQSNAEMLAFKRRWNKAVEEDECWVDPY